MKFLFICIIISFSSGSYADNWSFNFLAEKDLFYDDNVTMTEKPQESFAYRFVPTLVALYQTEVIDIKTNVSYGTEQYIDIDEFDFIIQDYGVQGIYRTEKTDSGLSASFTSRPSLDTAEEDSGDFNTASNKETASIGAFFTYQLTDIDEISIDVNYIKNTSTKDDFSDNDGSTINLIWSRQWIERLTTGVNVLYSQFDFDGRNSTTTLNSDANLDGETSSDNYEVSFSANLFITEHLFLSSQVGVRFTNTKEKFKTKESERRSSNGFITATTIGYEGERFSSSFSINQSLVPSTRGELSEQSSLILILNYELNEDISASFLSSYRQTKKESDDDDGEKRKNIKFKPSINWEVSEHFQVSGSYEYNFQDESEEDFTVDSNLFMLSVGFDYH